MHFGMFELIEERTTLVEDAAVPRLAMPFVTECEGAADKGRRYISVDPEKPSARFVAIPVFHFTPLS
jgi:hypothetical protein